MNARPPCFLIPLVALLAAAAAAQPPPAALQPPEHGFFTALPKQFARLLRLDARRGEITVALEGAGTITRPLRADADLFIGADLGTAGDLVVDDRVWVVFDRGASGEPGPARFIADEIGLQTIHGEWHAVAAIDREKRAVLLRAPPPGGGRPPAEELSLPVAAAVSVRKGERRGGLELLAAGDQVRFRTRFRDGRREAAAFVDAAALEVERRARRAARARELDTRGAPGEVARVDAAARSADLLLYRPAGDAARDLAPGDSLRVHFTAGGAETRVSHVRPWGEKTRLTVELPSGAPLPSAGEAVRAMVRPHPPAALPPGVGRATDREARVEWLLASIYCTCLQRPDVCTGHLYTLAMCHPKNCGMPETVRKQIGAWIDARKTDAEILAALEKEQGPLLRQIHLLK